MNENFLFFITGLVIGLSIMGFIFYFTTTNINSRNTELEQLTEQLERELETGSSIIGELREQIRILIVREQQINESLKRAENRNTELEAILQRTGSELITATGEARSIREIISRIINIVEQLFPENPGGNPATEQNQQNPGSNN